MRMQEIDNFSDYIQYIRERVDSLIDYKDSVGHLNADLLYMKEALHNDDPFILHDAVMAALLFINDERVYH